MIVEHTFVTTLDEDGAFAEAEQLLTPLSFRPCDPAGPSAREWRRGKHDPAHCYKQSDLPHRLRMIYDRGRVALAASVEFGSHEFPLPKELAVGLTLALERRLALAEPIEQASTDILALDRKIRFRDRLRWVLIFSFLGIVVAVVVAAIVAAMRH